MTIDPKRHHRRSIRLKGYDYSQPGAYFVTLVTQDRECLFGEVVKGEMRLNRIGKIVYQELIQLARRFPHLRLAAFVIMPNHVHAILEITEPDQRITQKDHRLQTQSPVGLPQSDPDQPAEKPSQSSIRSKGPLAGSLGVFIGQFKSRVTKRLGLKGNVWQRNYYEHIIRDEVAYTRVLAYIQSNPQRWTSDQIHPEAGKGDSE